MSETRETKRLVRARKGRLLAGVCAGIAEYAGIDVTVIRLLFVVLGVVTAGVGVLIYLAGWIVIPEEGEDQSIAESMIKKTSGG